MVGNCNEYNLNPLTRNNWRASLVPAAAVIPAPIAYIKVAAVKKLVVGFLAYQVWPTTSCGVCWYLVAIRLVDYSLPSLVGYRT